LSALLEYLFMIMPSKTFLGCDSVTLSVTQLHFCPCANAITRSRLISLREKQNRGVHYPAARNAGRTPPPAAPSLDSVLPLVHYPAARNARRAPPPAAPSLDPAEVTFG
jgi:hypothetical protein